MFYDEDFTVVGQQRLGARPVIYGPEWITQGVFREITHASALSVA
jgi:hypothetical protein